LCNRNTSCSLAKLVKAEPFDGCTAFTNPGSVVNSIVVVKRGGCTFVDKAVNIQVGKGGGKGGVDGQSECVLQFVDPLARDVLFTCVRVQPLPSCRTRKASAWVSE
jgi:hypothetical protein